MTDARPIDFINGCPKHFFTLFWPAPHLQPPLYHVLHLSDQVPNTSGRISMCKAWKQRVGMD